MLSLGITMTHDTHMKSDSRRCLLIVILWIFLSGLMCKAAQSSDSTFYKHENVWYAYKTIQSGSESADVVAPQNGEVYAGDLYIPSSFTIADWYNAPRITPHGYRDNAFAGQSEIVSIWFNICETEPLPAHFKGCDSLKSIRLNESHSNTTSCYRSHGGQVYFDETYHDQYAPAGTYKHKYHLKVVPNASEKNYVADEGDYFYGYFYPILYPEAFENMPLLETISFSSNTEIPTGGWCRYANLREFNVTNSDKAIFTDGVLLTTVPGATNPVATVRSGIGIHQSAVQIPSAMGSDIPVTNIGSRAFEFGRVDELTLSSTITNIESQAFKDFVGSIVINGDEEIAKDAFINMSGSISVRGVPGSSFLSSLSHVSTSNVVIKCSPNWFDIIRKHWDGKIEPDRDVWIEQDGLQPNAARFTVKADNPEMITIVNVSCNGQTLEAVNGVYKVEGIHLQTPIDVTYLIGTVEKYVQEYVTVLELNSYETPFATIDATITNNAEEGIVCVVNFGRNDIPSDIEYGVEIEDEKYPATDGKVRVPRLLPADKYYIYCYVEYDCQRWYSGLDRIGVTVTQERDYMKELRLSYNATESTVSIEGAYGTGYNLLYDEASYSSNLVSKDSPQEITGLTPNTDHSFTVVLKSGAMQRSYKLNARTKDISTSLTISDVSPTALHAKRNIDTGDTQLVSATWRYSDTADNEADICGIPVNVSEYGYTVEVCYAPGKTYSKTVTQPLKRDRLTITTLDPKVIAEGSAVVCAATNASDKESGVGFQWIRYDAPSSLKPSEGFGAIYDGIVEGYINNLQSTSYYNVRAIYKDAEGAYTYGEWVTFDPSDFSYFEPTVHTYEVTELTHTSAMVRGYAMPGSDEIISQGFEYWIENPAGAVMRGTENVPAQRNTVSASGQVMSATIENLQPSTVYGLRSFVITVADAYYGEIKTFTTDEAAGAISMTNDGCVTVIGYYDLNGTMHSQPVRGVNIVLYSDGGTKKIFISQ